MSLLWSEQRGGTLYKVVQAGHSIRLYRNGVLHSQWNPKTPIQGNLWELFLLTSLRKNVDLKKVLVLGAGGGAVINLLHYYFPNVYIDAIELDRTHIQVARKYFKVNTDKCKLICADVDVWLKKSRKTKYDLIIDDVFQEKGNSPTRSISVHISWLKLLLQQLRKQGTLAINFADQREWRKCRAGLEHDKSVQKYQIAISSHHKCQNKIVHIAQRSLSATVLKNELANSIGKTYLKYLGKGVLSYRRIL